MPAGSPPGTGVRVEGAGASGSEPTREPSVGEGCWEGDAAAGTLLLTTKARGSRAAAAGGGVGLGLGRRSSRGWGGGRKSE